MSSSRLTTRRWWQRLFSRRARIEETNRAVRPVRLEDGDASRALRRAEHRGGIEPLEGRIAPAALLPGGLGLSYTDLDGDSVAVHFSQPIFGHDAGALLNADFDQVFHFSTGDAHSDGTVPQQLWSIDLTKARTADGVSLSITVTGKGTHGDGLANIGAIEATNVPLGTVSIQGDLGKIDCGEIGHAAGLVALRVASLGVQTGTQTGTPSYTSDIVGHLGSFQAGIVLGAYVDVTGTIGSIDITKHLAARSLSDTAQDDGQIQSLGNIGSISIGSGNAPTDDAVIGGLASDSGTILCGGSIGQIHVTGNLHGNEGTLSGSITASKNIGSIDVHGRLLGGSGDSSGFVRVSKSIGSATIGTGSGNAIEGGSGDNSGGLVADGALGSVTIHGGILGGSAIDSGRISAGKTMGSVLVQGSLTGAVNTGGLSSDSNRSGSIESTGAMGALTITGDVLGGDGDNSGFIGAASLPSLIIGGKLDGGTGETSGAVQIGSTGEGSLGLLHVGHGLLGNSGDGSGAIDVGAGIGSLIVGKAAGVDVSLQGGTGNESGLLMAGGSIGSAQLLGGIAGGAGLESGGLEAGGSLGSVTVGGSITGMTAASGSTVYHNGFVDGGSLGAVVVTGSLIGGGDHSGIVASAAGIASIQVKGSVHGGVGTFSGSIVSGYGGHGEIGSVSIGQGLIGGAGDSSGLIDAGGALGSAVISLPGGGSAGDAILGGGGLSSGAIYADRAIGTVVVHGSIAGGAGERSGSIEGHASVASVTLQNLEGGAGKLSGSILSDDFISGSAAQSGNIGAVHAAQIVGGSGPQSGSVRADGNLGQLVAQSLELGSAADSATVATGLGLLGQGQAGSIAIAHLGASAGEHLGGTVQILGALGRLTSSEIYHASVQTGTLGTLSAGSIDASTITALGHPGATGSTDLAIARVIVSGNVSQSELLAGFDFSGALADGHAQIGSVSIHGNWTASDLVAGAKDVNGDGYGNADDVAVPVSGSSAISSIASVTIGGTLAGDGTSGSYGFEAERIGSFRYGSSSLSLHAGIPGEVFANVAPGVSVREVVAAQA